ncbi:CDP-glycerol glycerophosphotransferase family protein [bacterium]|nr:CDP-glycerol glycerophosphotransferase family protein [bacterium]
MTWLFYLAKCYALPVVAPLVKEAELQGISIAFYVSRKVDDVLPEEWRQHPVFTDLESAIEVDAKFVLCPGNFVDFRLPGVKVELFHGIGIEKPSHYQIRHFFDLYLTSGPVVTARYETLQRKYKYFRVIETGWPKIDFILDYDTAGLRDRFDIAAEKKIVLYAPTHSRRMQSAEALLPDLESIIRDDEVWFCKPHELMNKSLLSRLSALGKGRFRLVDGYDITPYLHLADVMISDTSSVIYEFMVLDKPIVTYNTLDRFDKAINIRDADELRSALDRCFRNPGEMSASRHDHLNEVNPVLDGSISRNIFDALDSIDTAMPLGTRRKPLNLFRKAQLLYHSRYRKGYLR